MIRQFLRNILISIDQLANTLLGGDPDETLSSRAGKWHPWVARFIDWVFGRGHCAGAAEPDEGKDAVIK